LLLQLEDVVDLLILINDVIIANYYDSIMEYFEHLIKHFAELFLMSDALESFSLPLHEGSRDYVQDHER
jgi:hypothetical protein